MKWIELIEVRSVGHQRELVETSVQELVLEVQRERTDQRISSYRRSVVHTDFSIHLFHDSDSVEQSGSQLGLRIASALSAFGSVNHKIWIEI